MVLRFRRYAVITEGCIRSNRQRETGDFLRNQKKYLSNTQHGKKQSSFLRQKFENLIVGYDKFTGMDEVRLAQKRVLEDEQKFRKLQEERRVVSNKLNEIQRKLKELHVELESTFRGDDRYVILVTQESKLLKEEKIMADKFSDVESAERDAFAALSSSVKASHEKERAQSERTKYWSIIGSVLGTVLGLLGSSISNQFKMNELKELIKNSTNMQLVDCLDSYIETNEKIIEKYKASMGALEKTNYSKLEKIINSTNTRLDEVENSLKKIEKNTENHFSQVTEDGKVVTVPVDSIKQDTSQIKLCLFSLAILTVLMPIISRYS